MSETYKKRILAKKANKSTAQPDQPLTATLKTFVGSTLKRPIYMLCTEPIVCLFSAYVAFNFALLYAFFAAFPYVFKTVYDFSIDSSGLTFLGLGVGCLIGCIIIVLHSKYVYKPRVIRFRKEQAAKEDESKGAGARWRDSDATMYVHSGDNQKDKSEQQPDSHGTNKQSATPPSLPPEQRLWIAIPGTLLLPISLFLFAWTARPNIHWIVPVIAECLFGMGNLLIFMAAMLYIMDTYGAKYGASAMAGNTLLRYIMGAVFPLFSLQMYEGLEIGWATSLLGFISCLLAAIPWCFMKWGPRLRAKSGYKPSQ